jgi:hypothetical protein
VLCYDNISSRSLFTQEDGYITSHKLDDPHDRSSVEVEQSLECSLDPRDFYSADSPVRGDSFDSNESNQVSSGAEVQDDIQANTFSSFARNVRFSYLSHMSHTD